MRREVDLSADLGVLAAEDRGRLGEAPTPEELLAYRDGRLREDEAERVRDRLAVDPEAAALYLDVRRFPDLGPVASEAGEPRADVRRAWRKLSVRLGEAEKFETPGHVVPLSRRTPSARRRPRRALLAAAAVVAFALALAWLTIFRSGTLPGDEAHVIVITGADFRGSGIPVPPNVSAVVFRVDFAELDPESFEIPGSYVVELVDASGRSLLRAPAAGESREPKMELRVPTSSLKDGATYELTVRAADAGAGDPALIREVLTLELENADEL